MIPEGLSAAPPEDLLEEEEQAAFTQKKAKKLARQAAEDERKRALAEERRIRGVALAKEKMKEIDESPSGAEGDDLISDFHALIEP